MFPAVLIQDIGVRTDVFKRKVISIVKAQFEEGESDHSDSQPKVAPRATRQKGRAPKRRSAKAKGA